MTVTTEANHIGEVWINSVIRSQEFELVIAPRVFREWKFTGHGDVHHIPRIGNLTANTKSAGSNWTPEALTDTEQTITINVHQVAGFELEDIAALLSNTDVKSEYQKKIGYALGRAVDVNLAALFQNFSQIVGTLGTELTWDNLITAWQYLADGGTSASDDCTFYFSPGAWAGLMKLDIVANSNYRSPGNAGRAVEKAQIGELLGAPVMQTNLLRAPAAGQHENALFKRNAVALMMAQEPKMVTEYRADALAWIVGAHQVYGYVEVDRYAEAAANVTAGDDWAVLLRGI